MNLRSISEFCKTGSGGTPSRKNKAFYLNGNIPWIKSGELSQTEIFDADEYITEEAVQKSSAKLLEENAILLAMYGATVGQVAILRTKATTNQAICHIYPDKTVCELNYLYRVLEGAKEKLLSKRVGGGQPNISQTIIKDLKIPLPPLPEQKRIARILDATDALRSKRRQAIAMLDELLQATFLDMFGDPVTNPKGWEVMTIGDLMSSVNYGSSKKASEIEGQYPILRMNNITYLGAWDFTSLKYIDLDDKEKTKHLVYKGQILFNRTNSKELVGKTAVYRLETPMAFAGYLVRAVVNDENNPEYIGAFMNLPQTKQLLKNKCKNIVGMANINAKEFQRLSIPKPPLTLQTQFAKIVEKVEAQKVVQQAHLAELDTLFASLQQRAFAGEL